MRTREFGKAEEEGRLSIISRDELERIDRKIKYVRDDYYYADEYLDLLKLNMACFSDFAEKVDFVLQNIDIYHNKNMRYAERKWHHETVIRELFTGEERTKIELNDCYKKTEQGKEYLTCITVAISKQEVKFYLFSNQNNNYEEITIEKFGDKVKSGEVMVVQMIPALKAYLKKQAKER